MHVLTMAIAHACSMAMVHVSCPNVFMVPCSGCGGFERAKHSSWQAGFGSRRRSDGLSKAWKHECPMKIGKPYMSVIGVSVFKFVQDLWIENSLETVSTKSGFNKLRVDRSC